jgi:hypothetical protein
MAALSISVVGRVAKSTPTAFWANHLAAFKSNGIPVEIDTQTLQYSTKKGYPWAHALYSDIAKGRTVASTIVPTVPNTSAQRQDGNNIDSGLWGGSNRTEEHPVSEQGAIHGLSNLKRKMEEIDRECTAFKIEQ